ncbi:hypothetical protein [Litorivivens sp.]
MKSDSMARGSAALTRLALAMPCSADIAFSAAMLEDVVITALRKAELL